MLSLTKKALYFLYELLPKPSSIANLEYRNKTQLQPLPCIVLFTEINTPIGIQQLYSCFFTKNTPGFY